MSWHLPAWHGGSGAGAGRLIYHPGFAGYRPATDLTPEARIPPMCGITDIFDTRGTLVIDANVLRRMNDSQLYRGPDEGCLHFEPGRGLGPGACRSLTSPLASSHCSTKTNRLSSSSTARSTTTCGEWRQVLPFAGPVGVSRLSADLRGRAE